ncbi:MAG: DUF4366 domain-containing protein [Lachnospiraceae bacterium]|nr:DUF4366 domain-containing protein [Lachnospiraceae bacterium]
MKNLDELISVAKLQDLLNSKKEVIVKEDEGKKVIWALAVIGAIASVVLIAVAVYKYLSPDDIDDFDDVFFDDDEEEEKSEEEAPEEE